MYSEIGEAGHERAIELFIKAGDYFTAIEWASILNLSDSNIKKGVNLAFSLKLNEILKKYDDYKEKLVRLKLV